MHPSQRLRGTKGGLLAGKRVVLGVSGSIAAVETVRIAHELQRHGADVVPIMTRAATEFVTPLALEYATGHKPILELSGAGEHIGLLGTKGSADLLLVAPATANTIAKMALGIDDTSVTTCATVAIGAKKPVLVAPAMHEVMKDHPGIEKRLRELTAMGVHLVAPRVEEEKAKIADAALIADHVMHHLATGPFVGRNVLVISGSTAEPLDPVRVVTNRSSGRMGVELATAAYRHGARVELWNAWGLVPLPAFAKVERFESVRELERMVDKTDLSRFDVILVPAALSDFAPQTKRQKVSSDAGPFTVTFDPLPKILPKLRKKAPRAVLVGFKTESQPKQLLARARERLATTRADLFIANTSQALGALEAEIWFIRDHGKPKRVGGAKSRLAEAILAEVAKDLSGSRE